MSARWEDVNARCRGLGTHLLREGELAGLEGTTEWRALARLLQWRLGAAEPAAGPRELDAAILRRYGAALAVVERWLGPRRRLLRVVWEDEERRALRGLVRGAAEGASLERRLEGTVPTASLPERVLRRIAGARTPAEALQLAVAAGIPLAAGLRPVRVGPGAAGLLEFELALSRAWAERAVEGARGGGRTLRRWVAEAIDAENALALAVAEAWAGDLAPGSVHLPGGDLLGARRFTAIAGVKDGSARIERLRQVFRRGPVRSALDEVTGPAELERAILRHRTEAAAVAARREPLGPWPTIAFLLRARLEVRRVGRASWGLAFGHAIAGVPAAVAA